MRKLTGSLFLIATVLLISASPAWCFAYTGVYKGHLNDGRVLQFTFHGQHSGISPHGVIQHFHVADTHLSGGSHRVNNLHFSFTSHSFTKIDGVITAIQESASGHWKGEHNVQGTMTDRDGKHFTWHARWLHH